MAQYQLSDEFVVALTEAQPRLYGFILKRTANHDHAREILQEANLVMCRKANEYEPRSNFMAWAFRVAHFQIMAYRKKRVREKLVFDDELLAEIEALDVEERRSQRQRRRQALGQCLERLQSGQRTLIERRYFHGASVQDIAGEVNKTVNAVSKILHRIRQSLMRCVSQRTAGTQT